MKKRLLLLACFILAASAAAMAQDQTNVQVAQAKQAEPSTWKTYTVEGDGFSVSLPTVPAMTTYLTYIKPLKKYRKDRMLGVYADGAVYEVNVYENLTRQLLEDFILENNGNNEWDPASETKVTVSGITGSQYSGRNKNNNATAQFFAAEGRLYKFAVGGDQVEDAAFKKFFSSIVLGQKATGIALADGPGQPFEASPDEETFTGKVVTRKARLFMKPEPRYTEEARQKLITGTVILKVVFSSSGAVTNVRVVAELPNGLTENAIDAVKKIKFCPAIKDGKYVSMWMQLEYNFNLY